MEAWDNEMGVSHEEECRTSWWVGIQTLRTTDPSGLSIGLNEFLIYNRIGQVRAKTHSFLRLMGHRRKRGV